MPSPSYIRSVVIGEGLVLYDTSSGSIFTLNLVGTLVWQGLKLGKAEEEIAISLADRFKVSLKRARDDTHHFAEDLRHLHLVV